MIEYFWKSLRTFIWAKIEQHRRNLDSFEKLCNKAKYAKIKAILQFRAYAGNINQHSFRKS